MGHVVVGYLVTLPDGYECRLGPDLTRAQNYAIQQHAVRVEPMFVLRDAEPTRQDGSGGANGGPAGPG